MNAGQYIVALSGLPSGSAAQHLLSIQLGTGTGPGQTIFASRFSVVTGEDRFTVVRKAKRQAPKPEAAPRAVQQLKPAKDKGLFAVARSQGVVVATQEDSITVIQKTQPVVATRDLGAITINRKRKSP